MRLLTRRIYRAFPELDRYSDEQCVRFLKAARGSWLRKFARLVVVTLFAWVTIVAGLLGAGFLTKRIAPGFDLFNTTPLGYVLGTVVLVAIVSLGPVGAFIARDVLLRRRVRFVLRSRGVCTGCWYSLVGLPVGPANLVHCPECGVTTTVDPALGELVTDADGRPRFRPEVGHVDLGSSFWTPRRKRVAKRTLLWGTVTLIALAALTLVGNEWFIRRQAEQAKAARPGIDGLLVHVRAHQPPGSAGGPNAYDVLTRATQIRRNADDREWAKERASSGTGEPIIPEFSLLYGDQPWAAVRQPDPEHQAACTALARRMLDIYTQDGLDRTLAEMAAAPAAVRSYDHDPAESLMQVLMPDLGELRSLTRICAARMELARAAGDRDEFLAAFEQGLALGRMARHQPLMIDGLTGVAIDHLMLKRLSKALHAPLPGDWLDGLAAAMSRQQTSTPLSYHLEGERIMAVDTIAWTFSDPDRVRWGRLSPQLTNELANLGIATLRNRLGTLDENINAYTRLVTAAKAQADADPAARPAAPATGAATGLILVDMIQPAFARAIQSRDQIELHRRGVAQQLSIERFRAARGRPPATLGELVPAYLDALPSDPYTGKPYLYRVLSAPDEHGRLYLLYSTGADGQDDGGISGDASRKKKGTLEVGPMDVIVNEVEAPPARE